MAQSQSGTSDRDLSLAAVAKLAVAEGYANLTVPCIRAAAGISRQRFDAEFEGVEDCLSAAREEHIDAALANASRVRDSVPEEAGPGAAILALCAQFADDSALARLCFAVDCKAPNCLVGGGGVPAVDRVANALYGEKAAKRPSVAIQAGAGMVWTMIEIHSLSKQGDALKRTAPLMAALA
jgi:AcrR family transcriptional regulator